MNQTINDILAKVLQEMKIQNGELGELIPIRLGQRIFDEESNQAFRAGDITYARRIQDNPDFAWAWSTRLGHTTPIPIKTFKVLQVV